MCGKRAYDWNTIDTSRSVAGSCVTSAPPIDMRPLVAISSPAIMRNVVVLPQPDGPSSVTSLPASMVKETSLTAGVVPPG